MSAGRPAFRAVEVRCPKRHLILCMSGFVEPGALRATANLTLLRLIGERALMPYCGFCSAERDTWQVVDVP